MTDSTDPTIHRGFEQQMLEHVSHLLEDERLRIDTTLGRRSPASLIRTVSESDGSVDIKRLLTEMNRPDRQLQSDLPQGKRLDVVVSRRKWGLFRQSVGRLLVMSIPPVRDLVAGTPPEPMDRPAVQRVLSQVPAGPGVPTTVVLVVSSGMTLEARDLAERTADRTVILAQPNNAGGWTLVGPAETKALTDLFDPEPDDLKRQRVREVLEQRRADLGGAGIAADRLAQQLQLPAAWVDNELKAYARETPGLSAKRLDGRLVLFRDGSSAAVRAAGGGGVAFIDRMRTLFSRKGEVEKKVAFLAERRAALSQQRDLAYEEMQNIEGKEDELHLQFKATGNETSRKRIASQLVQVRKDLARRQQLIGVLNQQLDVIGTHLHNLELLQQGESANLPDSDEITADAARAEEMLAQLQADAEVAGVSSTVTPTGLSAEEQAVYDELLAEAKTEMPPEPAAPQRQSARPTPAEPARSVAPARNAPPPIPASPPRRSEPEAS